MLLTVLSTAQMTPEEIKAKMTRPGVGEVQVSAESQARTASLFGQPLTPSQVVERILSEVRLEGRTAVARYTRLLDKAELGTEDLLVSEEEVQKAYTQVTAEFRVDLELAIKRIRGFHQKQMPNSWLTTEEDGIILGTRYTPVERAGLYVPGGSAPLVSSVLMTAIPAQVAGVREIIMATPPGREGQIDPHLLVAADQCGVRQILKAGGAQAIGALAYGIEGVPKVDVIAGPGNLYVTLAKQMVYGLVGIDMLAGPSEILVIADESANPAWVAADLLSQAEHDWDAAAVLITPSMDLLGRVQEELEQQISSLSRQKIARESLQAWGVAVLTDSLDQAAQLANLVAPEHLELAVRDPWSLLGKIQHAGAIFLGHQTSEPLGDYLAGTNHVLPTNGTARFSSPLGVQIFLKQSSLIQFTSAGLQRVGPAAARMGHVEGLDAHARAVEIRLEEGER